MKRYVQILAVTALLTFANGFANAADSADNAAKNLLKEVQRDDYPQFRRRLVGKAGQDYGGIAMFQLIKSRIEKYKKIEAHHSIISSEHGFRVYETDIYGRNPRHPSTSPKSAYVITATVQCAADRNYEPGFCYGGWDWGWGWGIGTCFPPRVSPRESCFVSALKDSSASPMQP